VPLALEVKAGPLAGRRVPLTEGKTILVGRSEKADFAFPADNFMSTVHCALQLGPEGCRLTDRNSANGTFLNGARIKDALVRDGDEITAGHTTFVVRIAENTESRTPETPPQTPPASLSTGATAGGAKNDRFSIGSWSFTAIPSEWETIEQHGIRRTGKDIFPSNAVVSEEPLPAGKTLQQYIDSQITILQGLIPEMKAEPATAATVAGAEEALDMHIRHTAKDGQQVLQRQLYARAKQLVGVLTLTTIEKDFASVQSAFERILSAASFKPQ
jgi:pSer/pThr/pTyr-binding forkhead associated (FHA) protein